jgi:hypothetical protein
MSKFVTVIILLVVLAVSLRACIVDQPTCIVVEDDTPIYSLALDDALSGSFFIGISSVNQHPYYYVYVAEQGGVMLQRFDAEKIVIQERDDVAPTYRTFRTENSDWMLGCSGEHAYERRSVLIVPKGTVRQQFVADARGMS